MNIQRLNKVVRGPYAVAHKYYQILSVINDLNLAEGEVQLIAFTAIEGNISDPSIRKLYVKTYSTTIATINNIVHRLKKKNIIHKKGRDLFINPVICKVDFSKSLALLVSVKKEAQKAAEENILNMQKHG